MNSAPREPRWSVITAYSMLLVGLGSALGGMTRFGASVWVARTFGETFLPAGTLFINVTGSFAIGFYFALTGAGGRLSVSREWREFFTVGVCGGYTTFSSFSLQTLALVQRGDWLLAGLNALGSVVLCFLAVWLGVVCALALNPRV